MPSHVSLPQFSIQTFYWMPTFDTPPPTPSWSSERQQANISPLPVQQFTKCRADWAVTLPAPWDLQQYVPHFMLTLFRAKQKLSLLVFFFSVSLSKNMCSCQNMFRADVSLFVWPKNDDCLMFLIVCLCLSLRLFILAVQGTFCVLLQNTPLRSKGTLFMLIV